MLEFRNAFSESIATYIQLRQVFEVGNVFEFTHFAVIETKRNEELGVLDLGQVLDCSWHSGGGRVEVRAAAVGGATGHAVFASLALAVHVVRIGPRARRSCTSACLLLLLLVVDGAAA